MQTIYDIEVFKKMNMAGFMNFDRKAFYIVNSPNLPDEKIDSEYGTIFINKYPTKPIYDKLREGVTTWLMTSYKNAQPNISKPSLMLLFQESDQDSSLIGGRMI